MRSPDAALLAVAAALALLGLASTASRGLYGVALDGEIERIEVRHEKHPPLDDVHLAHVGGDTTHLDRALALQLRAGDRISKSRLDGAVSVNDRELQLRASRDLRRGLLVLPLMVLLCAALLRSRPSDASRRRATSAAPRAR